MIPRQGDFFIIKKIIYNKYQREAYYMDPIMRQWLQGLAKSSPKTELEWQNRNLNSVNNALYGIFNKMMLKEDIRDDMEEFFKKYREVHGLGPNDSIDSDIEINAGKHLQKGGKLEDLFPKSKSNPKTVEDYVAMHIAGDPDKLLSSPEMLDFLRANTRAINDEFDKAHEEWKKRNPKSGESASQQETPKEPKQPTGSETPKEPKQPTGSEIPKTTDPSTSLDANLRDHFNTRVGRDPTSEEAAEILRQKIIGRKQGNKQNPAASMEDLDRKAMENAYGHIEDYAAKVKGALGNGSNQQPAQTKQETPESTAANLLKKYNFSDAWKKATTPIEGTPKTRPSTEVKAGAVPALYATSAALSMPETIKNIVSGVGDVISGEGYRPETLGMGGSSFERTRKAVEQGLIDAGQLTAQGAMVAAGGTPAVRAVAGVAAKTPGVKQATAAVSKLVPDKVPGGEIVRDFYRAATPVRAQQTASTAVNKVGEVAGGLKNLPKTAERAIPYIMGPLNFAIAAREAEDGNFGKAIRTATEGGGWLATTAKPGSPVNMAGHRAIGTAFTRAGMEPWLNAGAEQNWEPKKDSSAVDRLMDPLRSVASTWEQGETPVQKLISGGASEKLKAGVDIANLGIGAAEFGVPFYQGYKAGKNLFASKALEGAAAAVEKSAAERAVQKGLSKEAIEALEKRALARGAARAGIGRGLATATGVNLATALPFAISRLAEKDPATLETKPDLAGAALELAGGIPGIGLPIQGYIVNRDIKREVAGEANLTDLERFAIKQNKQMSDDTRARQEKEEADREARIKASENRAASRWGTPKK